MQNPDYRHVVLFKFKPEVTAEAVERVEAAFRDLCKALDCVRAFEWGRNSSPEGLNDGYTHCFIVTFASPRDRDIYLPHPAHERFCREFLDATLEKACVVDFHVEH